MQASISTSKLPLFVLAGVWAAGAALATPAWAFDPNQSPKPAGGGDEFSDTPHTRFGEFNEEQEEADAAAFFRYGRFFGVGAGIGYQAVSGNRGIVWRGGTPLFAFHVHYWFNFTTALDLEFTTVPHNFLSGLNETNITVTHLGLNFRYYIDTTNLSDAVTFAQPFLLFGAGAYTKTQSTPATAQKDVDGQFGMNLGLGLQFPIQHKKLYFDLEGKLILVRFLDSTDTSFSGNGAADLSGNFWTITGSVIMTW